VIRIRYSREQALGLMLRMVFIPAGLIPSIHRLPIGSKHIIAPFRGIEIWFEPRNSREFD
jgi:hypothetical protein